MKKYWWVFALAGAAAAGLAVLTFLIVRRLLEGI